MTGTAHRLDRQLAGQVQEDHNHATPEETAATASIGARPSERPARAGKEVSMTNRERVRQTLTHRASNGGFVFNAIHNVQTNTPLENIVAMIDAVHEFNGSKS